jgi:alpha-amylase
LALNVKGLIRKLKHIEDMGFNAIWISPIPISNFAKLTLTFLDTEKGYHGYWAKDLYKINPEYGTVSELKELIKECHSRDVSLFQFFNSL